MTEERKFNDSEINDVSGNVEIEVSNPDGKIESVENASNESEPKLEWYILKVQSNREDSVKRNLEKRIRVMGLERYFGHIIVPTESITEIKGGKRKVIRQKLYPGYVIIEMEINDDSWYLVRQTSGIGDFVGANGKPITMLPEEVERILQLSEQETEKSDGKSDLRIAFAIGDSVKVTEGTFMNYEGVVDSIDTINGRVTVMISYFGRSTPVELEYWQVESL